MIFIRINIMGNYAFNTTILESLFVYDKFINLLFTLFFADNRANEDETGLKDGRITSR